MNETARISIGGVDCQGCAVTIEKNVKSLNGVDMAEVNVIRGDLSISFDPDIISQRKSLIRSNRSDIRSVIRIGRSRCLRSAAWIALLKR